MPGAAPDSAPTPALNPLNATRTPPYPRPAVERWRRLQRSVCKPCSHVLASQFRLLDLDDAVNREGSQKAYLCAPLACVCAPLPFPRTQKALGADTLVFKGEIPRELYFVYQGALQLVDEHDRVLSVIRSDVPNQAPIVGEVKPEYTRGEEGVRVLCAS